MIFACLTLLNEYFEIFGSVYLCIYSLSKLFVKYVVCLNMLTAWLTGYHKIMTMISSCSTMNSKFLTSYFFGVTEYSELLTMYSAFMTTHSASLTAIRSVITVILHISENNGACRVNVFATVVIQMTAR